MRTYTAPRTYREIIKEIDDWHETRKTLSYHSIYHGTYLERVLRLNEELVTLTGFTYEEHKQKQREVGR